jgi:hypothetical protein
MHAVSVKSLEPSFSAVLWVERTHEGPFLSVTRVAITRGGGEAGVDCADTIYELQYARLTTYSSESIAGMMDEKNTSQKA